MAGAWFYDVSPTSIGQPNIELNSVEYSSPYNGGSEPTIQIDGGSAINIKNIEELSLTNIGFSKITSSYNVKIENSRIESGTYGSGFTGNVIWFQNSNADVDGFTFVASAANVTSGTFPTLINQNSASANQYLKLSNIDASLSGSGYFIAAGGNVIWQSPPALVAGNWLMVDNAYSASGNTQIYAVPPSGCLLSDDQGDTSMTFVAFTSCETSVWNTALTTNRTITLTTGNSETTDNANYLDGLKACFVRTANATGASTLTVNASIPSSKTLAAGTFACYRFRRSIGVTGGAWVETESGSL